MNLAYHLKSLDSSTLASQVLEEQVKNEWPGLAAEVREMCQELDLPDILLKDTDIELSDKGWKKMVNESIRKKNSDELKIKIGEYSKLESMKDEMGCEIKGYMHTMTMHQARMHFRLRTKMFK